LGKLEKGYRFGVTQTEKGQLYQVKNRQKKHEAAFEELMMGGLLTNRRMERRVVWFDAR